MAVTVVLSQEVKMQEEDDAGGFRPPPWVHDDFTLWRIGWAREEQRGIAEALAEAKQAPVKKKPTKRVEDDGESLYG
ncbi:MAG: hypothetical protein ABSG63_07235 [Spirochaetia bacterium]|jgi:hypothetical protein